MIRKEGWEERLIASIRAQQSRTFDWKGASDCFVLAMDAVVALTGEDPYADVRGSYSTRAGALKQIAKRGFADLAEAMRAVFPEIPVSMARRGDIAAVDTQDGLGLAVIVGHELIGKAESGNIRLPVRQAKTAFRIG